METLFEIVVLASFALAIGSAIEHLSEKGWQDENGYHSGERPTVDDDDEGDNTTEQS